ncbi:hypothetical protein [Brevibacillus parabrevis]|jgi:hypothetical protein|uniref:hypothetical protein n=1 Tax=Brevibacillus parabrevis TaxID=54914 RepID=UPI002493ABBF|nr:hypothetical protein [Brevibacillus parabrevis]
MQFTINVMNLINISHRLSKDGEFKSFQGDRKTVNEEDWTFTTHFEAEQWLSQYDVVKVGDRSLVTNPVAHKVGEPYLTIRAHRTSKPEKKYFTKEEVREQLVNGDDEQHNVLIVDWNGNVKLVPFNVGRKEYAVRYESFQAGNGYVGRGSSLNHFDSTYSALLEGWLLHLKAHDSVYRDYSSDRKLEEIIKDIEVAYNEI